MAVDMKPKPGDYSINIPITFDYKGGRSEGKKGRFIISALDIGITLIVTIGLLTNHNIFFWWRLGLAFGVFYIGLFIIRFFVFNELWFSDTYETLKESDYELPLDAIWNIFEIDYDYPYICYFKNGFKGIFVRMEKDAITGKPDENMYDHYEAIGDAYNLAHSLNMNIIHIDYMDNVGNDSRMQKMYDDLNFVDNPDMQEMLIDIYANLQDEMSRNYASFDIYLYLTKDKVSNFIYNMQSVCNRMLGGNFITYKVLDRFEIARVCTSLFNLHEFSIADACENVLQGEGHSGIIPIKLTHGNGSVEKFNKTMAEKKIIADENARKLRERQAEEAKRKEELKRRRKEAKKNGGVFVEEKKPVDNTKIDLFEVDEDISVADEVQDEAVDLLSSSGVAEEEGVNLQDEDVDLLSSSGVAEEEVVNLQDEDVDLLSKSGVDSGKVNLAKDTDVDLFEDSKDDDDLGLL